MLSEDTTERSRLLYIPIKRHGLQHILATTGWQRYRQSGRGISRRHGAVALETQFGPDSVNTTSFLKYYLYIPAKNHASTTVFEFVVDDGIGIAIVL